MNVKESTTDDEGKTSLNYRGDGQSGRQRVKSQSAHCSPGGYQFQDSQGSLMHKQGKRRPPGATLSLALITRERENLKPDKGSTKKKVREIPQVTWEESKQKCQCILPMPSHGASIKLLISSNTK